MKLYDVEDYEYREYLRGLCLAGLPIPFYNKVLNHISVRDIFAMGEDYYNSLVSPFRLNSDVLLGKKAEGEERFLLDILSSGENNHIYLECCVEFLKTVFGTNNINIREMPNDNLNGFHKEIIVDDSLWLDKYKFEELSEIIQKMCRLKKMTEEDIHRNEKERRLTYEQIMSIKDSRERDYQLAIYNKNKKEDDKKKNILSLYSVYNYVCHFSNLIDYEKPLNFNPYQLYNTYEILMISERYRYDMRLMSSGMVSDFKKMDTRWFNERITQE